MNLSDLLFHNLKSTILSWSDELIDDIYVISLFFYNIDDDPRYPTVTLGYNTNSHYLDSIPLAADSDEAKWDYAFYLQNEEFIFGYFDEDQLLVTEWAMDNNLDEDSDDEDELSSITRAFIEVLISVVQRLHNDEEILSKLKKDLPILIHDFDYFEVVAAQNSLANPNGTADEFIKWIYKLYE